MEKKVMVTIKGIQKNIEGQGDNVELITEGKLYQKDGVYLLEYEESEISGLAGTTTIISVLDKNTVTLERKGTNNAHFVFEKGRKSVNTYATPFGILEMGVFPSAVTSSIDETGGSLHLKYQLDISGNFASLNELNIQIKEGGANAGLEQKS